MMRSCTPGTKLIDNHDIRCREFHDRHSRQRQSAGSAVRNLDSSGCISQPYICCQHGCYSISLMLSIAIHHILRALWTTLQHAWQMLQQHMFSPMDLPSKFAILAVACLMLQEDTNWQHQAIPDLPFTPDTDSLYRHQMLTVYTALP